MQSANAVKRIPWKDVQETNHFRLRVRRRAGVTPGEFRRTTPLTFTRTLSPDEVRATVGTDPDRPEHSTEALYVPVDGGVVVLAPNETGPRAWVAVTYLRNKEAP